MDKVYKKELQFKIGSYLKNIIGSDLINDDFIAVFELVKNAYDAHATDVKVIFDNIYSEKSKIIITDNGKGMNYNDLIEKWLFVAHSAKKEGTEDKDYRNKIKIARVFAGAKGIGRFSCDRLGSYLYLETTKDEKNAKTESLITDWNKFEEDSKQEFVNISVLHETKIKSGYEIEHGTVLEITNLRSQWNREKFLKLKDALSRLINPTSINKEDIFNIEIIVKEEIENDIEQVKKNKKQVQHPKNPIDESIVNYFKIVNGNVENLIFETLGIKTTYIVSKVNEKEIETKLFEAGKEVYTVIEKNPFNNFKDISFSIYFLNQSAKIIFSKRMGLQPVDYGHIFVYKNGLRIFPYGERGEDPLKMDNRKAQGYNRFLGTREVLGYISINGINENLRETSSRGDGLIKTQTYFDIEKWFYETLKKLEKYSIEITDWGNFLTDDDYINFNHSFLKNEGKENETLFNVNDNMKDFVRNLTSSKNILKYNLSKDILKILENKTEKSVKTSLSMISEKLKTDDFDKKEILDEIKKTEKKLIELQKNKQEAEEVAFIKTLENEKLNKELKEEISKKFFDNSINNREKGDLLILQHQIVHTASSITFSLDELIKSIDQDNSKETLIEQVLNINLEVKKILSTSRFVSNAGFNLESEKITEDIIQFIYEYVLNNYIPANSFIHQKKAIEIVFDKPNKSCKKVLKFRPLEITVLLDNLFSNSKKSKSKRIDLNWLITKKYFILSFKDDGIGIPEEIKDKIFNFGYSQTDEGSGIGLFQVRDTLNKINSEIEVNTKLKNGVEFLIKIPV
jgi:signal transduction histidine kinase